MSEDDFTSNQDHSNLEDVNVPHEANVADAIDDEMRRTSEVGRLQEIATVDYEVINHPASPSVSYTQAEAVAVREALVALIGVVEYMVAIANANAGVLADVKTVLEDAELVPNDD